MSRIAAGSRREPNGRPRASKPRSAKPGAAKPGDRERRGRKAVPAADTRTRRSILELLKWNGPQDATALAARLGVSPMAVRLHLYELAEEKLVVSAAEPRPMGRPAKLWRLTPAADEFFPDAHADLTLSLIQSVRKTFGEGGFDRLIRARSEAQVRAYRSEIPDGASLERRLAALARLRTREGYMADVMREDDVSGAFLFVENHCPICVAASACTNLCAGELAVFQEVLGKDVKVERTDHILAGARRCAYRVSEVRPPGAARSRTS